MTTFNLRTHNGSITMYNNKTGKHRTVSVRTVTSSLSKLQGKRVVSLLTGDGYRTKYVGFAFVDPHGKVSVWKRMKGTKMEIYAKMVEFPWKFERRGIDYKFAGRCRICNRELTNPLSIDSGIGPVCARRIG